MAKVTITLTDTDLDAGQFVSDIKVEESQIDDGFMSAAHVTAVYFIQHLNDPVFQSMVMDFAMKLTDGRPDAEIGGAVAGQLAA